MHGDRRLDASRAEGPRQLAAIHEPHHGQDTAEPDQRDRCLAQEKAAVRDGREAADQHVLGIAGQRRDASHVGGRRQRDQVRHGGQTESPCEIDDERRHHHTDHVVHEQRRERAGRDHDGRERADGRASPAHRPRGHQPEESGEPEVGGHDHHAEEQDERARIHGGHRGVPVEHTGHDHRGGAHDGHAGAVDAERRQPAEAESDVGAGEDGERQNRLGRQQGHPTSIAR